MSPAAAFDLDAYCARVGYAGPRTPEIDTLHAVVARHAETIPFENLDVLLGLPIRLDAESLQRKLIQNRRGGYCFEQNGLLLLALGAFGFRATPIGARVRWQIPRDVIPARTHLFLRVDLDGTAWLADVGIGSQSLTAAIQLDLEGRQVTPHESRRILRENGRLFHQSHLGGEWQDVCEFTLDEMHPIDRELANWWTSASPQSHFKNRLVVARAGSAGRRYAIRDREFIIRHADGRTDTQLVSSPDELLALCAEHFGLHFPPGTRFGPPGSPWPA